MTWNDRARQAIKHLASTGEQFDADDLILAVGHPDSEHEANNRNNAIGAIFGTASKEGLIEAVGVKRSEQPHRKGGMVRVWQGRLHRGHHDTRGDTRDMREPMQDETIDRWRAYLALGHVVTANGSGYRCSCGAVFDAKNLVRDADEATQVFRKMAESHFFQLSHLSAGLAAALDRIDELKFNQPPEKDRPRPDVLAVHRRVEEYIEEAENEHCSEHHTAQWPVCADDDHDTGRALTDLLEQL